MTGVSAWAIEYVSALLDGDALAGLVVVATEELVGPPDPVRALATIRSGAASEAGLSSEG